MYFTLQAADFRKFWGVKSELRRFQDGSIREAVVWSKGKTLADKRIICKKIIKFLLKTKFSIFEDQYLFIADQLEDLLKLHKVISLLFIKIFVFELNIITHSQLNCTSAYSFRLSSNFI